jgi:hypothetical protein
MSETPKPLLPSASELRRGLVLSALCAVFTAPITILFREVLSILGVLDPVARAIANTVVTISPALAGWLFALVVALAAQAALVWWFTRRPVHIHHKDVNVETKPEASLAMEVHHAAPPSPPQAGSTAPPASGPLPAAPDPSPRDTFNRAREQAIQNAERAAELMRGPLDMTPQEYIRRATGSVPPASPPSSEPLQEFDYPYRKAVLQAEVRVPVGTQEARAGHEPHKATWVMTLVNKHSKPLHDCSVILFALGREGEPLTEIEEPLRIGSEATFTVDSKSPKNFPLLSRDISDTVTPAPFIMRTVSRQIPLADNTLYYAGLALHSRYPHPTIVFIMISTRTGLAARIELVRQWVEEEK